MTREHHVYTRHIDLQQRSSLSVLANKIQPGSRVLDLGCGPGVLGQYLQQHKACTLDGVTFSAEEAALARPYYRDLAVADLEQINLAEAFTRRQYDYIVCADVLEHLRHPEQLLADCRDLLAENGEILVSIPNAGYCGLVMELMQGELRYREEGLLDSTHLRFFTRQSLLRLMQAGQWSVQSLETIDRPLDESEFARTTADSLPPAVMRYLLAQPDALAYQFICSIRPSSDAAAAQAHALLAIESEANTAHASFTTNLYWADAGQFSESHKLIAKGQIGALQQSIRFALPRFDGAQPCLRWDPADRPGFLHLHAMRLYDASGALRWRWEADQPEALAQVPHSQISWQPAPATAPGSTLLLLTGDDPHLHLPIAPALLQDCLQTEGAVLEVSLGWPMSADYAALADSAQELQARIRHADTEVLRAQQAQADAHTQLRLLQAHMQDQKDNLEEAIAQQQEHIQGQQTHIHNLQTHLSNIEASEAYRVGQKLASAKARLRGRPAPAPAVVHVPEPKPVQAAAEAIDAAEVIAEAQDEAVPAVVVEEASRSETLAEPVRPLAAAQPATMVDIIVPVYRGLGDTQRCLQSVLQAATQTNSQLVVINDASPEPELTAWLRELAQQDSRVHLLENDSNLGFVATVNRGMALNPSHDVLLLNSDTEVSHEWLDRLHRAAYSATDVGSVTPLSNNATICSYPRFCEKNALPADADLLRLNHLAASANAGQTVEVPTGVGFCMYIRRDCLAQTGLFDVEHFGKGYGEENDFCMRAHDLGWRHLLALDSVVLHTGGVSFGDSKTPREQAAYQTLLQLHPAYDSLVQAHLKANPAQAARNAIDKARLRQHPLPRILMVLHNAGGGTLRHVKELAHSLRDRAVSLALTPLEDNYIRLQWLDAAEGYDEVFHWPTQSEALVALLRELGVSHIHFHHLMGLNLEVMRLPELLGVRYDFTAHDYYAICPQINLMEPTHNPRYAALGVPQCPQCSGAEPAPTGEYIDAWRMRHRLFLNQARYVLAPSKDAALRMHQYFPEAAVRYVTHHDIPDAALLPVPKGQPLAHHAHLRVFILGGVSLAKGGDVMEAVALAAAQSQAPVELHLLGYPHRRMRTQPHASLTIHGPYDDADLPALMARLQPDVVWFPALWPETYSYTLSACLQAGVPVIAPDIGAFPERLAGRPWTWLRPWSTSADEWLALMQDIRQRQYVEGQPPLPAPAAAVDLKAQYLQPWSYGHDYLTGLRPSPH
ncbi:methyltransferase domain-containing protein [Comamonas koreensis]|uniref:Methyltransferase domain-containing protein n=1 Tax=Comamonas koreensis TaxID=160825 RepID=A0AAW4Y1R3_9BURK|nr:methyltransferase domain-containing protein [Comamonas koreensis]MCD2167203.1 methyltransferase domain-containing protein [Comamonas koreensis]